MSHIPSTAMPHAYAEPEPAPDARGPGRRRADAVIRSAKDNPGSFLAAGVAIAAGAATAAILPLMRSRRAKAALPGYRLAQREDGQWALTREGAARATRLFPDKASATAGSALAEAIGRGGGRVSIEREDGSIEEQRTFATKSDEEARNAR